MNRLSRILRPTESNAAKTKSVFGSRSHALLIDLGFIKPAGNGTFYMLPLMQRSIEKCTALIDQHMHSLQAQKVTIPNLTSTALWRGSGRFDDFKSELFVVKDREEKSFVLGPTFEEAVTDLVAACGNISQHELPLRLYQIGNKFRDELKPRYGLLRAREFLMKDLYTFDADKTAALQTYDDVSTEYIKLFNKLSVPYAKVEADAKQMGGISSHEYHYLASIGDELLVKCSQCGHIEKNESESQELPEQCSKCSSNKLEQNKAIEVGHTFYLGNTYTKRQKANYLQLNGKPSTLEMGCHGIGITRLIAAAIETLSSETEIRWPAALAPFAACLILPKKGSKEEKSTVNLTNEIMNAIAENPTLKDSCVIDDQLKLTIGSRMREVKKIGFPLVIVIGKRAAEENLLELHNLNDNSCVYLSLTETIEEILKFLRTI